MSDFITVAVTATKGSVPRDAGTTMRVWVDSQDGTIGGGALEFEATHIARRMLMSGERTKRRTMPLGPDLGQCCGGAVTLDFSHNDLSPEPTEAPLWIWGAGHVGRAIAGVIAPFNDRHITLIDTAANRMPDTLPTNVSPLVANDPVRVVAHAPQHADHLILTYSHDIDLALCDSLLRHGFGSVGLIGSATKWARFQSRLVSMGHSAEHIARIACPIGDPSFGKHPQAIAVSVAATLILATAKFTSDTKAGERTG
jgi:xanthine dehydrogenase accessory factor